MKNDVPEFGRPARIEYENLEQKAVLEARNGLLLLEKIESLVGEWDGQFHITPELLKKFHRITISGIYGCAGEFRAEFIGIENSAHVPPNWKKVPGLVDEMCEYANEHFQSETDAIQTAAYLLWRINWIHPFMGGNGRVARAISYLAICAGFNAMQPGTQIIPTLIDLHREGYEYSLECADKEWNATEEANVDRMETYLGDLLILQYESAL